MNIPDTICTRDEVLAFIAADRAARTITVTVRRLVFIRQAGRIVAHLETEDDIPDDKIADVFRRALGVGASRVTPEGDRIAKLEAALRDAELALFGGANMLNAICETDETMDRRKAANRLSAARMAAISALTANQAAEAPPVAVEATKVVADEGKDAAVRYILANPEAVRDAWNHEARERRRLQQELHNCEARIREQRAEINRLSMDNKEPK